MNINITIFIQIVNVLIGFLILKYLLFKPALKYLQAEEKKKENMSKNISDQENLLDSKIQDKSQRWKEYQRYFSQNCPKLVSKKTPHLTEQKVEKALRENEDQDFPLSEQEITNMKQHVEKALIERLEHVKN